MSATRRNGKPPPFTEWHGNTLRAKLRIPEDVRFLFPVSGRGKRGAKTKFQRVLYKELNTDDPGIAEAEARAFVTEARTRFEKLSRKLAGVQKLRPEAGRWRDAIQADPNSCGSSPAELQRTVPITMEELEALDTDPVFSEFDALVDRAYDLQDKLGHARTMSFFNLASGKPRAIGDEAEGWLRSEAYSNATKRRYQKTVQLLLDWCRAHRIPPSIEEIDEARALRFLNRKASSARLTKAKDNERATLSRLWQWSNANLMAVLKSKIEGQEEWIGDIGENPWRKCRARASSRAKPPRRD